MTNLTKVSLLQHDYHFLVLRQVHAIHSILIQHLHSFLHPLLFS